MAYRYIDSIAKKNGARVIPVDSEHSAIFSLFNAHGKENIEEIILTCSGGPFLNLPGAELENVKPEDALRHPTWKMGSKITIDSASLANKGLEVIEANRLFGLPPEKIKVVIHRESIVHSAVRTRDGEIYAQSSLPDMRLPIHNALFFPEVVPSPFGALRLVSEKKAAPESAPERSGLTLTFTPPDTAKFPMLALAYEALARGPLYPVAYNAANEEAVAAFIRGVKKFKDIPRIVEKTLDKTFQGSEMSLDDILAADSLAREIARQG
jgi:1-deoxy-D-xylulose-5-phosphate reductoisomerase